MCVCVLGYDFLKLVGRFGIILFHFYYRHICGPNVLRTEGHLEMTLKATIYGQKKKMEFVLARVHRQNINTN